MTELSSGIKPLFSLHIVQAAKWSIILIRLPFKMAMVIRENASIFDTEVYRVSKHRIWVDQHIAIVQEKALVQFHAVWSNFAD